MRAVTSLAIVALLAASCGSEDRSASPPVVTKPPAAPSPSTPPPDLEIAGPPPAWIETAGGDFWLAYATYCWKTGCADYVAPSCGDGRTPTVVVEGGEVVRFHLGFEPEQVSLRFFAGAKDTPEIPLAAAREPTWKVDRAGAFWIGARAASGEGGSDASYAGCFHFGSTSAGNPSQRCSPS